MAHKIYLSVTYYLNIKALRYAKKIFKFSIYKYLTQSKKFQQK